MNAAFKLGTVRVVVNERDVEREVELITLSGGFLGKDDVTRPATDEDRVTYKAEYELFRNPPPTEPTEKKSKVK